MESYNFIYSTVVVCLLVYQNKSHEAQCTCISSFFGVLGATGSF